MALCTVCILLGIFFYAPTEARVGAQVYPYMSETFYSSGFVSETFYSSGFLTVSGPEEVIEGSCKFADIISFNST